MDAQAAAIVTISKLVAAATTPEERDTIVQRAATMGLQARLVHATTPALHAAPMTRGARLIAAASGLDWQSPKMLCAGTAEQ